MSNQIYTDPDKVELPDFAPGDVNKILKKSEIASYLESQGLTKRGITNLLHPDNINRLENLSANVYQLQFQKYTSDQLSGELIDEIADFYRWTFDNKGHYLYYPQAEEYISPQQAFYTADNMHVNVHTLDLLSTDCYPTHPQTEEKAIRWHNPEIMHRRFREKLGNPSHVVITRDKSGEINRLIFGSEMTIEEQFELEGWRNPLFYAGREEVKYLRNFEQCLGTINDALAKNRTQFGHILTREYGLQPDSPVYAWNCIITAPNDRGLRGVLELCKQFFMMIPDEIKNSLIVIGEAPYKHTSHQMFRTAGAVDIHGVLQQRDLKHGDHLLVAQTLQQFSEVFSLPPEKFSSKYKLLKKSARD